MLNPVGIEYLDLSLDTVAEPGPAISVGEGNYAVAQYSPGSTVMLSRDFLVCKWVSVYDHDSRSGMVAHISRGDNYQIGLKRALDAYGQDLGNSEVHIAQTRIIPDNRDWPGIESIVNFFLEYGPKRLVIDTNRNGRGCSRRGFLLDLCDGAVEEIHYSAGQPRDDRHLIHTNQPLRLGRE